MSHMQPDIRVKQLGWMVETRDAGTCYVPGDVVSVPDYLKTGVPIPANSAADEAVFNAFREVLKDFVDGNKIDEIEVVRMYFARLSAPGYLDCTEWCGFTTLKEAREYLRDL